MIRIKVSGLDRIKSKISAYQRSLADKQRRFLERLAQIGIDVADVRFKEAQYDGVNDVEVSRTPEWDGDNRLFIVANGTAVAFIEFGTGVHYTEQHPKAAELGMVRGGFGQGKGAQDGWGYYGSPGTNGKVVRETDKGPVIFTHGNPPARAMYDAGKQMKEDVARIAREVFGSD